MKKFLSLILAFSLLVLAVGCKDNKNPSGDSGNKENAQSKTKNSITMLYSAADSFNPYVAKTDVNKQLCQLLYEPLIKLDSEFNPVYAIAKEVVTEQNKSVVTLKNVSFSDDSPLTARDVVYSFLLAKSSQGVYATQLYEAVSAVAVAENKVEFVLSKQDPYFINLLTFPILKAESDTITDSDGVLQPPIGSGKYMLNDKNDGLIINPNSFYKQGNIKTIKLINAPDNESVTHYAQVGAADVYYSNISDGRIVRMSGKRYSVNLNNMVYLGINKNVPQLSQKEIRQALASGIDRTKLCKDAFYNNAIAATGFFSPVWNEVKSLQNIQIEAKKEITIENLEKIGYNRLDSSGNRINSHGTVLSFTLLVNSENQIRVTAAKAIASQLSEYGIKIKVIEKTYNDYLACLSGGSFELFLGEIRLTDNMDISCMVSAGGSAAFGLNFQTGNDSDSVSANPADVIAGFYSGVNSIADVVSILQNEMPFIPLCYRTGVLFCNDKIENVDTPSVSDIYSSIESYIYKN